jgi:hypothetical protein
MGTCCSKRKKDIPLVKEPYVTIVVDEPQGRPPPIRIPKAIVRFSSDRVIHTDSRKHRAKNKKRKKKMNTR